MINQTTEKVVPIVMNKIIKYDLIDELRINQYGKCSVGAMYRIVLEKGYESITKGHMRLREQVGV
jgi:hypothetical protein